MFFHVLFFFLYYAFSRFDLIGNIQLYLGKTWWKDKHEVLIVERLNSR